MTTTLAPGTPEADADAPRLWQRISGRTKLIVAVAALIALIAASVWVVAFSAVFGVRSVHVHGLRSLTSAEVVAAAQVPHGTPLVRFDSAAVERRLDALPEVAKAAVTTSWPDSVEITITERIPVAYMQRNAGFALIDSTGKAYLTKPTAPTTLPLLVLPSDDATGASDTYRAAASIAAALPSSIRGKVASVQALSANSVTLLLDDQRVVAWGSAERNADKARVLVVLLTQANAQIDVTNPDIPFTR